MNKKKNNANKRIIEVIGIILVVSFIIMQIYSHNKMYAIIKTNYGEIKIELFKEQSPITVENFVSYAKSGFYNGTVFHRIISNFMIQGGGFTPDMVQKETSSPIENEANNGLSNEIGTIAMARTNEINSATSQFFINVANNTFLDYVDDNNYGYAVFGKVVSGMDVVEQIKNVQTTTKTMTIQGYEIPFDDWPVEDVIIEQITIIE